MKKSFVFINILLCFLLFACTQQSENSEPVETYRIDVYYTGVKKIIVTGLSQYPGVVYTIGYYYTSIGYEEDFLHKSYSADGETVFPQAIDIIGMRSNRDSNPPLYFFNTSYNRIENILTITVVSAEDYENS
jgi:hypothetical protein